MSVPERPAFAPGVRVRITCGLAAGVEGVVLGPWFTKRHVQEWRIKTDDLVGHRVIREDYLERIDGAA